MTTGELIAAVGLAVPVASWFATSALQTLREQRHAKVQSALDYTALQLAELYGPLNTLVIEGEQAWAECARSLGRDPEDLKKDLGTPAGDGGHLLQDDEMTTWVFWVETVFFHRNDKIEDLLANKAHLIDGRGGNDSFPRPYRDFLEHHNNWKTRHLWWKTQPGSPYNVCWTREYPTEFTDLVEKTFDALKDYHHRLLTTQRDETWSSIGQSLDVRLEKSDSAEAQKFLEKTAAIESERASS